MVGYGIASTTTFSDKEVIMIVTNTLYDPCYNMLVGNGTLNFTDLAISDKMIKYAIKSGKIDAERKEGGCNIRNLLSRVEW